MCKYNDITSLSHQIKNKQYIIIFYRIFNIKKLIKINDFYWRTILFQNNIFFFRFTRTNCSSYGCQPIQTRWIGVKAQTAQHTCVYKLGVTRGEGGGIDTQKVIVIMVLESHFIMCLLIVIIVIILSVSI